MQIDKRPRRLRYNSHIRDMVRETDITVNALMYPVFVVHGKGIKQEINAMPGIYRFSIDMLLEELKEVVSLNIPSIMVFGIPDHKDEMASEAYDKNGIVQQAIKAIKDRYPELVVTTDVCLCEYTANGHCGLVNNGMIVNDPSVELIARTALSHVEAGADMVAPSDMMDGRVGAIRRLLDKSGYDHIPIMAYSAKYASAYYGPFREAADSAPKFGDRRSYQMDPANAREALREIALDIEEGADIIMVKPALAYLDVIAKARATFNYPVAAYNVSGEYSMIKAAGMNGWIDEKAVVMETMTAIRRAGADIIITYFAKDVARWLITR
ncbi:porphobilinogen synthase [Caldanaerobius fijiensis DSM 17918]|uniref:Delta-aminolevulinic acid dehydratase n=1 Tax=Caldanaerobius fijiensis DSM 17918 TaxID=1121256 RepID=A0A1M4YMB2_9THEO|nr:porphobilinogen synthase [Caldanaerobius fijiensis]SHF06526.1 porphobilinogen synthase [Caldanaerobius fijiensis DSM 17918]